VQQLSRIDVDFSLRNILGGGAFPAPIQKEIVVLMGKYLQDTGKLSVF
jgi:hypothetical protein